MNFRVLVLPFRKSSVSVPRRKLPLPGISTIQKQNRNTTKTKRQHKRNNVFCYVRFCFCRVFVLFLLCSCRVLTCKTVKLRNDLYCIFYLEIEHVCLIIKINSTHSKLIHYMVLWAWVFPILNRIYGMIFRYHPFSLSI